MITEPLFETDQVVHVDFHGLAYAETPAQKTVSFVGVALDVNKTVKLWWSRFASHLSKG